MDDYIKITKEPIEISYFPDEDDRYNYQPSFLLNGTRYWLQDFIRTKNTPWVQSELFPDYIDAYQANEYVYPLYIQLVNDIYVDVYVKKLKK